MLARIALGCAVVLVTTLGCAKTEPAVSGAPKLVKTARTLSEPVSEPLADAEVESPDVIQTAAEQPALPLLDPIENTADSSDDLDDELSPAAEAKLLAALAKQPNNAQLLVKLASMKQ